jgi:hypothetical protein
MEIHTDERGSKGNDAATRIGTLVRVWPHVKSDTGSPIRAADKSLGRSGWPSGRSSFAGRKSASPAHRGAGNSSRSSNVALSLHTVASAILGRSLKDFTYGDGGLRRRRLTGRSSLIDAKLMWSGSGETISRPMLQDSDLLCAPSSSQSSKSKQTDGAHQEGGGLRNIELEP